MLGRYRAAAVEKTDGTYPIQLFLLFLFQISLLNFVWLKKYCDDSWMRGKMLCF